jgi:hypothetical protein
MNDLNLVPRGSEKHFLLVARTGMPSLVAFSGCE